MIFYLLAYLAGAVASAALAFYFNQTEGGKYDGETCIAFGVLWPVTLPAVYILLIKNVFYDRGD